MLHQPIWAVVRAALCDRIDEAAVRQQRLASLDVSMPSSLLAAGLWLSDQGVDDTPCAGETFFAWGPAAYCHYLDRLTPDQRTAELATGRRVIFDGLGNRPPLVERFTVQEGGFFLDAQ